MLLASLEDLYSALTKAGRW